MTVEGVDYAGSRPDPGRLYAAGKRFVCRYGGPGGSWKHLTASEAASLAKAGLWLVANAEGSAGGLKGRSAGADWARSADSAFRALGMPADRPIYLSADWDVSAADWPAVADALRGAASVIGAGRVGVYGSYDVVRWAARDRVAAWYWQTYAWSAGRWHSGNHLEQYRNGVTVAGGDVDLCRAKVTDYGQWQPGRLPTTAAPTIEEDDMAWLDERYNDDKDPKTGNYIWPTWRILLANIWQELSGQGSPGWPHPSWAHTQEAMAVQDALAKLNTAAAAQAEQLRQLAATPPGTVTIPDEQLVRALRVVLREGVDGASPPAAG